MKNALDEGISLFPHRIHPLPHESDLPNNTTFNRGLYLPNIPPFSKVTTLDPLGDDDNDNNEKYIACCDGGNVWPGFEGFTRNPVSKWWENGFHLINKDDDGSNNNNATTKNKTTNIDAMAYYNLTKIKEGHRRLLKYKWMRLKDGVGIVFASNNNGRFCVPSKTMCISENNNNKKQPTSPMLNNNNRYSQQHLAIPYM